MKIIKNFSFFTVLLAASDHCFSQTTLFINNTAAYGTAPAFANGAKYKNFTDAITVLNATSLNAEDFPVVYEVANGQVFYEPVIVPKLKQSGLGKEKNIVFEKDKEGINPVIIPAAGIGDGDYGIALLASDFVIFDGIDIKQGTDGERNEANKQRIEFGYYIISGGTKDGATYNIIKNCTITLNRQDINTIGIYQRNTNERTSAEGNNSYNHYLHDNVYDSYRGIVLKGSIKYEAYESHCSISHCTIGSKETGPIGCPEGINGKEDVCGILLVNEGDALISYNVVQQAEFYSPEADASVYGINCLNLYGNNNLYSNRIHDIIYEGPGTELKEACALQAIASDEGASTAVYNHFIGNILNFSMHNAAERVLISGIKIDGPKGTANVYHNSVYFSKEEEENQSSSSLLYIPETNQVDLNVKNNIFKNYLNAPGARSYCFYLGSNNLLAAEDNIYDCIASGDYFTGFYHTPLQTLHNWQTVVSTDVLSKQFEVPFNSAVDLYVMVSFWDHRFDCRYYINNPLILLDIDDASRNYPSTAGAAILRRPPSEPQPLNRIIDCNSPITNDDCSIIQNNTLSHPCAPYDPQAAFEDADCSPNGWAPFNGSPDINGYFGEYNSLSSFAPGINFASMNFYIGFAPYGYSVSEGVVIRIRPLVISNNYTFSMFKHFKSSLALPCTQLDQFQVILLHCDDYASQANPFSYNLPDIPGNSQIIYCETNISNTDWEQIATKFTADDNYDMLWIRPYHDPLNHASSEQGAFAIVLPQLVSNDDHYMTEIVPSPGATECFATLTPACPIRDAAYEWVGPSNQTLTGESITVDGSDPSNIGTWTLTVTGIPNAITTSNVCLSQAFTPIITTVDLKGCCVALPKIH